MVSTDESSIPAKKGDKQNLTQVCQFEMNFMLENCKYFIFASSKSLFKILNFYQEAFGFHLFSVYRGFLICIYILKREIMGKVIKVAVVGGTGKSGRYLVRQLLNSGYKVRMLLRDPDRSGISNPDVETVTGNVLNIESVRSLLTGCSAVISTLGMGNSPTSEPPFSKATANILDAMSYFGMNRYIVITGLNVNTPHDKKSLKCKAATDWMYENYPVTTTDKQLEYDILGKSSAAWTMLRLPLIEMTDRIDRTEYNLEDCPGNVISVSSLAFFLTNQLNEDSLVQKAPFLYNML